MGNIRFEKRTLSSILSGSYTPPDLHSFVQLCYSLALPFIRRKITLGKVNPDVIGLREHDIVHDCLADLFHRDESSQFIEIKKFFDDRFSGLESPSDEALLQALRELVLGKVKNNIVRLYAEADPALGRILRNMLLALDRTQLFEKSLRFGETYLVARGADSLIQLAPMPLELVEQSIKMAVRFQDRIPMIMRKLHRILSDQSEYQRTIPFVATAVMIKQVYAARQHPDQVHEIQHHVENEVLIVIERVCKKIEVEMGKGYIEGGKKTPEEFAAYMRAIRNVLCDEFVYFDGERLSYYQHLLTQIPSLTRASYADCHRTIFEHVAGTAKEAMRQELRSM